MRLNIIILLMLVNLAAIIVCYTWIVDSVYEVNDEFIKACAYTIGNE